MKYIFGLGAMLLTLPLLISSCGRSSVADVCNGDTLTINSQLLTMVDQGDYIVADIRNPWSSDTSLLERYYLVSKDYKGTLPDGGVRVTVPLESSVVYSSVHGGVIAELHAVDAINGVADAQYFINAEIAKRIESGKIADVGNSMSVSIEKVVDLSPDAILVSPFQNKESGAVTTLGIPVVQCVDYMEATPLGRAEWIKFFGVLYGCKSVADSIYKAVSADYSELCGMVAQCVDSPVVLPEQALPSGEWNVPAGDSYMAQMYNDAGVTYPWADTQGVGSLILDAAMVLDKAGNADFWLIRYFGPLSLSALKDSNPINPHIKAYKESNVYVCNTAEIPLFDEFPFHPERLLREYVKIFHPTVLPDYQLRYFSRAM